MSKQVSDCCSPLVRQPLPAGQIYYRVVPETARQASAVLALDGVRA